MYSRTYAPTVTPARIPRTVPPPPRSTMRCQSWPTTTQGHQNAVQQSGPPPGGSQQPHALPPSQRPAGAGAAGWTTVVAVVTTMVGGGAPAITTGVFPGCWTACAVGAGCSIPTTVPERTTGSCCTTVPVATGTVVQQEPVVLSGTVVGMEQPAPTAHAVQQPGKTPVVIAGAPPPTMVVTTATTVVQPAAPAPAGRWLGGNACGCCDPPGGGPLCCTAFWCPCVVVGQLWHRIVERGGGGTVLGILAGVTVGAYVLEYITNAVLWWLYPLQIGWLWRLAMSFVYLFYMLKIREAAAREAGELREEMDSEEEEMTRRRR